MDGLFVVVFLLTKLFPQEKRENKYWGTITCSSLLSLMVFVSQSAFINGSFDSPRLPVSGHFYRQNQKHEIISASFFPRNKIYQCLSWTDRRHLGFLRSSNISLLGFMRKRMAKIRKGSTQWRSGSSRLRRRP